MSSSIVQNLKNVLNRIQEASLKRPEEFNLFMPRLVAVSKTKSIENITEAYQAGQRHFGENYASELIEKAHSVEIQNKCPDIKWHFIGHLQSNKIKKLLMIPNLFVLETIDSKKLADTVNDISTKIDRKDLINVMIQVNTSGEQQKNGVSKNEVIELFDHIQNFCKKLNIIGLMTIGSLENSLQKEKLNADFECLLECRDQICKNFKITKESLELSMGMSHDFEQAILMGSTNVRVGSLIFGSR